MPISPYNTNMLKQFEIIDEQFVVADGKKHKTFLKKGYLHFKHKNKMMTVHRNVLEKKLGRPILPGYHCHHIDGNKLNNHPNNLEELSKSEHITKHNLGNKYGIGNKNAVGNKNHFRGGSIRYTKYKNPWQARWFLNGKRTAKSFATKELAKNHLEGIYPEYYENITKGEK